MASGKVCFKCREYIRIFENNPENQYALRQFDLHHSGHPTQIVNELELQRHIAGGYKRFG